MTATQFADSKYKPMAFSMPFGANNAANYVMPKTAQDASNPNFLDGFPSAYSAPKSGGGKYVTREEMNGIGNLASRYEFFNRVGGIVTFDPALATEIGGYPAGAVLDYLDGYNLHKVCSLVDNNTVNFISVGVDNINWAYLNVDRGQIGTTAFSVSGIPNAAGTLGVFRATRSGMLILDSDIKADPGASYSFDISGPVAGGGSIAEGYAILIVDLGSGSSPSSFPQITVDAANQTVNWNGYTMVVGTYSALFYKQASTNAAWSLGQVAPSAFNMAITQDHWYGIVLYNATRELFVQATTTGASASTLTYLAQPYSLSGSFRLYYAQ